jgi:parallel beta-helix repeat protein
MLFILSCQSEPKGPQPMKADEVVAEFQKRLIEAKDGDLIQLPEGAFSFKRALSFNDIPNVTIKGAGKGKTILSFKEQVEGAEGLIIKNVKNITLEGFTVADSKGDAIKVQASENVTMIDLEVTWTDGKKSTNGAYGLYPVNCTNVLMEKCEASYAMDAGIYVGQSTNVVVRENYAHHNVAGIEIENTRNAEVYKNIAKDNTGGMMIFDMPDLPQANGYKIRFYDNLMENNNGENFAKPGIVVGTLPPGTGMLIMAHTDIEVYNNVIRGHKSSGIALTSWLFTGLPFESKDYDPFNSNIHIYDNKIVGTEGPTDQTTDFGKLLTGILGGKAHDIIVDGIWNPATLDENGNPTGICFRNNGEETSFVNLQAAKGTKPEEIFKNMDNDLSIFDCELPRMDLGEYDKWLAMKDSE